MQIWSQLWKSTPRQQKYSLPKNELIATFSLNSWNQLMNKLWSGETAPKSFIIKNSVCHRKHAHECNVRHYDFDHIPNEIVSKWILINLKTCWNRNLEQDPKNKCWPLRVDLIIESTGWNSLEKSVHFLLHSSISAFVVIHADYIDFS